MVTATERGGSLRPSKVESSVEFPHKAARPPSPPIRYELKSDSNTHGRYGIKRHRGRDKHEKPPTRNERSPTKTSPKASQTMKPKTPSRVNTSRVPTDDDDDNMSLISMTNLIADDVCRLQNCKYENIGPSITNGQSKGNESAIIDMNVNVKGKRNHRQQNHTTRASKPKKQHSSSGVWVNKPPLLTDYQTSDTGSMTSRSLSRSPQHSRRTMSINYESDSISEITPPRCAAFDIDRRENSKSGQKSGKKSGQKQSNPEETFREFLSSVATCLPTAGDFQHVQKSFSDAQTKFEITNQHGLFLHNHIQGQNLCHNPNLCNNQDNGKANLKSIAGKNKHSMLLKHGNDILDSNSVTSASSLPYFRNNSDRYNHLVNGRELAFLQASNDQKQRKFSRSWFKSRRESNKRRNNTNVVLPQQVTVSCRAPFDEPQDPCSVEGLWNQSRSFDENEKRLYSKATKQTQPSKGMFKKLLKRGKSKERRRPKQNDSGKHLSSKGASRSVMITAKDPTKWPPEENDALVSSCDDAHILEASKCVASTIVTAVTSPGETAMSALNSDVAMALVGAPPASAVALAVSNAKKKEISQNRKIEDQKHKEPSNDDVALVGPVWRSDEPAAKPTLPSPVKKPVRKSLPRCYHRNSHLMEDNLPQKLSCKRSQSYDSPTTSLAKSHSYSEDDFGQEDFKVVSIIGHDVSSTELERYGSMNLPHNGGMANTRMSERHQQVFAPSTQRNSGLKQRRGNTAGRYPRRNNSPTSFSSYSTSSSSDLSSSDETSSSSSLSVPKRPIRARSKPQNRMSRTRSVDAAIMNDVDDEDTSSSEAALEAALLTTPWRKDYETHMASKAYKSSSIGPLEPPKIQRTALPNANIPRISPPRKDIPMRRLLV